jgi:hypothetical protein
MSWILMTAVGFGLMFAMRFTPDKVDFVLVRLAGGAFIGAGLMGASGWIGALIDNTLGWLVRIIDQLARAAVGTTVAWIVAAGIAALWIGAMLPDRYFKYDPPDWLVIGGLVLPSLVAMIPGRAGQFFDTTITAAGQALITGVGGIF